MLTWSCSCYGNWRAAAYYADLLYDKSRWSKVKHLFWKVLVLGHCSCGMYVNIRFVCAKRDTIIKHSIEQVCYYLPFMFYHWNVLLVFCYCVMSLDSKTSVGSTLLHIFLISSYILNLYTHHFYCFIHWALDQHCIYHHWRDMLSYTVKAFWRLLKLDL